MGEKYNPNNLLIVILKFVYSKKKDEEKSKWQPEKTKIRW